MELPKHPVPARRLLHTRKIVCNGYLRDDGLVDVESTMQDISPSGSDLFFKRLDAGEDLHRMRIVLTVDSQLVIRALEVRTEAAPTPWCAESNAIYGQLVGALMPKAWRCATEKPARSPVRRTCGHS